MHIKQIRVVVFYTVIMQFFIFPKNYLTSPWKIRPSHNTILPQKFKFFLPFPTNFFPKLSILPTGVHTINFHNKLFPRCFIGF